jgi:hypothetical protein
MHPTERLVIEEDWRRWMTDAFENVEMGKGGYEKKK